MPRRDVDMCTKNNWMLHSFRSGEVYLVYSLANKYRYAMYHRHMN